MGHFDQRQAVMASLSVNNVRYGGRALRSGGTLRVTENGMGFKSKQGKSISLLKEKIDRLEWLALAPNKGQLRVYTTDGPAHIYDGIPLMELEKIKETVKRFFNQDIPTVRLNTQGWNWGSTSFNGSYMNFSVGEKKAFDIPLPNVEQAHHDKSDVVICFPQDSSTSVEGAETLLEIRLWVPNTQEDSSQSTSAERVLNSVLEKAEVLSAKGTGIVTFDQVVVKTPRGRYDLEIFSNFMRMKGTQSSMINYDCITRITQLQTADERDCILVVSLDPPLRRGHTSYPHILMQFPGDQEVSVDLDVTDEQLKKYEGQLKREMSGDMIDVIVQVFKIITGIKLTKNGNFKSSTDANAVRCSQKAHDGYLYPLHKAFMFIYNPITLIPYEAISHVEFARLGLASTTIRTFDLVVFMKENKHSTEKQYIFNSISKDESASLENFLRSRGIEVRGIPTDTGAPQILADLGGDEEESEDEDFASQEEEVDELEYETGDAEDSVDLSVLDAPSDEEAEGDLVPLDSDEETEDAPKSKKKRRRSAADLSTSPSAKKRARRE